MGPKQPRETIFGRPVEVARPRQPGPARQRKRMIGRCHPGSRGLWRDPGEKSPREAHEKSQAEKIFQPRHAKRGPNPDAGCRINTRCCRERKWLQWRFLSQIARHHFQGAIDLRSLSFALFPPIFQIGKSKKKKRKESGQSRVKPRDSRSYTKRSSPLFRPRIHSL